MYQFAVVLISIVMYVDIYLCPLSPESLPPSTSAMKEWTDGNDFGERVRGHGA
jgi:hypothetical protein